MQRIKSRWITVATVMVAIILLATTCYLFFLTEWMTSNDNQQFIMSFDDDITKSLVQFYPPELQIDSAVSDSFVGWDINMTVPVEIDRELQNRGFGSTTLVTYQ